MLPDRPLTHECTKALTAGYLRGADLWHVACALYLAGEESSSMNGEAINIFGNTRLQLTM